jgi:hypothetical protein
MDLNACPVCREPGLLVPWSTSGAHVEYYRCDGCGTVWACESSHRELPLKVLLRPRDDLALLPRH